MQADPKSIILTSGGSDLVLVLSNKQQLYERLSLINRKKKGGNFNMFTYQWVDWVSYYRKQVKLNNLSKRRTGQMG
ncbi:hypothetical protein Hanom_Chr12g01129811 [Helianthus anomalus]